MVNNKPYNFRNKDGIESVPISEQTIMDGIKSILEDHFQSELTALTNVFTTEIKRLNDRINDLVDTNRELSRMISDFHDQRGIVSSNKLKSKNKISSENHNKDDLDTTCSSNSSAVSDGSTDTVVNKLEHTTDSQKRGNRQDKMQSNMVQDRSAKTPRKLNKHSRGSIIGSGVSTNLDSFSAADRKIWIYVGRCKSSTTVEDVKKYLATKIPEADIDIEQLISKGSNNSFKIGANENFKNVLYNPDFWPSGILVKRFVFFRENSRIKSSVL